MHIRLPSLCPDSRDGCTRRKGDRRGACLLCPCVYACLCIHRVYIYIHIYTCASFQKRVYAFFEGYSDEDARTYVCIGYIERYRVTRSDVEESSNLKRAIYTEEWKTDYKWDTGHAPQLDLSITFFSLSLSYSLLFCFLISPNKRRRVWSIFVAVIRRKIRSGGAIYIDVIN